jgi:hypothetical protein
LYVARGPRVLFSPHLLFSRSTVACGRFATRWPPLETPRATSATRSRSFVFVRSTGRTPEATQLLIGRTHLRRVRRAFFTQVVAVRFSPPAQSPIAREVDRAGHLVRTPPNSRGRRIIGRNARFRQCRLLAAGIYKRAVQARPGGLGKLCSICWTLACRAANVTATQAASIAADTENGLQSWGISR